MSCFNISQFTLYLSPSVNKSVKFTEMSIILFSGLGGDRAEEVRPPAEGDGGQHREVQAELREGRQGAGYRQEAVQGVS